MKCVITGPVTHLCPHVDEVDHGTFRIEFDGAAPELHALRQRIETFHDRTITHEELTQILATDIDAPVTTYWTTAGLELTVYATPERS